jgi:hypothetical protein
VVIDPPRFKTAGLLVLTGSCAQNSRNTEVAKSASGLSPEQALNASDDTTDIALSFAQTHS